MKTIKILTLLLVLSFFACKKDNPASVDNSEFVAVITTGGVPEKVEKEEVVLDSSVTDSNMPDGSIWVCTTKKYSITDGNSDFPLFNPNASVIYPGSLLQGSTLSKASPSIIPVKRAGGTISIDVIDGNLQPSFTIEEVTKSKIAEAANNIISGSTGVVPANFHFTAEEVQSAEQLSIELGLNFETQFVQVESQFSFRKDKEYHRFIVKLNQSFYTLSFDIPSSVKDIFAPEVTPQELSKYVGPGNPATFISDVTYGRVYYMLIESSSSSTEIDASLNASFTTATAGGGVDVNVNSLKSLSDLQIKVVALGGEAQSTFATIGETNISALVQMLGASTDIRTGVPISYVVRSVVDKEVVSVKLATEYEVKNCVPLAAPLGEPIAWWDAAVLLEDGNNLKPNTDQKSNPIPTRDALLDYNGRYTYPSGGINEHMLFYRTLTEDFNGSVVKKWADRSGNKIDADAISGVPDSRPMFIGNAFNNGRPAVEFMRGRMIGEFVYNRLSYSGGIFVNTDYTIFAVIVYPNEVNVHWKELGEWGWRLNQPNNYGYFMKSATTTATPLNRLGVGFSNQKKFYFTHGKSPLIIEGEKFVAPAQFKVLAFRFSKTEGMTVFQNGVKITDDITYPGEKQAIISYADALLSAPYKNDDYGIARIRIGEIKVFGVAGTDAQVQQETALLNLKFGL